jgi:Carbohydrate binding module (family 6)/Protein of unknown function (DUF1565)
MSSAEDRRARWTILKSEQLIFQVLTLAVNTTMHHCSGHLGQGLDGRLSLVDGSCHRQGQYSLLTVQQKGNAPMSKLRVALMLLALASCESAEEFADAEGVESSVSSELSSVVRVQFEDFKKGGEGVGYHDLDSANLGGLYRKSEGVDIEKRSKPDGYNVGWVRVGEWLTYEIKVKKTANYFLKGRLAAMPSADLSLRFDVDNGAQTAVLNVGGGSGLDSYQEHRGGQLRLDAGKHQVRVTVVKGDYVVNLDRFDFSLKDDLPVEDPVTGAVFYVSPSGDNGNPGTQAKPWRTIQKAAETLTAGQTVIVANGTYDYGLYINGRGGEKGKPITFRAEQPGQAKVHCCLTQKSRAALTTKTESRSKSPTTLRSYETMFATFQGVALPASKPTT